MVPLIILTSLDVHTPFLEPLRMITYRVSIGEWSIYYCHMVLWGALVLPCGVMGCPRHLFTCDCLWLTSIGFMEATYLDSDFLSKQCLDGAVTPSHQLLFPILRRPLK